MPHVLSQLLYCARWIGTLLVLAVHGSVIFVMNHEADASASSLALSAWRYVVSYELGRQGVVGFFVMSGFLVGGSVLTHVRDHKPFLLDYLIHRVARIYLVLIPAIALTGVLDCVGRAFFAGLGVYESPAYAGRFNPLLILTTILNLQGIVAPYFGTNGPLWSVSYEFWYYLLFPLLLLPMARVHSRRAREIAAVAAVAVFIVVTLRQGWFLVGFLLWGLGAAASTPRRPIMRSPWLALAINVAVVLSLRTLISGALLERPALQTLSDALGALAFANLILTLRFSSGATSGAAWPLLAPRIHKTLADFSFTVYAIHAPIIIFIRAAITRQFGDGWMQGTATPAQWLALAFAMTVVVICAFLLSRVTEAKTGAARRRLRRLVERITSAAPPAGPGPRPKGTGCAAADKRSAS